MIVSEKKVEPVTKLVGVVHVNRFDLIREAAAERHRKSDTDGTRRRARQLVEDHRLL
jgi:hypothetical protein